MAASLPESGPAVVGDDVVGTTAAAVIGASPLSFYPDSQTLTMI